MPAAPSTCAQAGATSPDKEENPELARFRQEWLEELGRRKANAPSAAVSNTGARNNLQEASTSASRSPPTRTPTSHLNERVATAGTSQKDAVPSHPAVQNGVLVQPVGKFQVSSTLTRALEVYRRAIEHEQKGELDEALRLYRQAFRMDDNVDRAYRREEMIKSILREQQEVLNTKPMTEVDQLAESFKEAVVVKPASKKAGPSMMTGTLAKLVQEFVSAPLAFEPEIENQPVLLNMLPEEVLVLILSELDPTSVERFARVCKKARVLSLDPTIWRKYVHRTYQPPQILDFDALSTVIERSLWDFRRVYIEQPRVRLDGIYIATCLYIRAGTSENSWVNSSHLITYHRYLRFFPNGQVMSLLANEEHTPQQIIPMLKPSLRMNGLHIGQWKLEGSTVHLTNLIDASGRYILPTSVDTEDPSHLGSPTPNNGEHPRYVFLMTLELKSRPLGRWNKMDILAYESLNLGSGEVDPFMLKNERPFWFSKVRSYGTG